MYPRGHRGVGVLALLLVLFLGTMALGSLTAQAQGNQIVGLVYDCNSPATYLGGAAVTLTDANGVQSPVTVMTAADGTYSFSPSPSNFTLRVTKSGYFAGGVSTPFRFDGSITVNEDICLVKQPPANKVLNVTVQDSQTSTGISGATVQAYNTSYEQVVASATTNATGNASLTLFGADFELRVFAANYSLNVTTVNTNTTANVTILLDAGATLVGHAKNTSGGFVSDGLRGWLLNQDPTLPSTDARKVIPATVSGSLYTFHAPTGTYTLVVDAKNYRAYKTTVSLTTGATTTKDALLVPSTQERFETTVLFGTMDWNNLTIYRNLTLYPDSTLPGLEPAGLRDLALQIDFTLGNADTVLSPGEATAFIQWLYRNGPLYTTTDGFLLTNSKAYNSSMTSFQVTVQGLLPASSAIWINTSATYVLKQTPYIPYGATRYYVNVTTLPDTNTSVYQNQVYVVQLPRGYEMVSNTLVQPVTVSNYTRITIDPGLPSNPNVRPQVRMVVEKAQNGTARGKITGPVGKFYVANASFENYQAYVAKNVSMNFSAEDSTNPPSGDPTRSNYTWRFLSNTTEGNLPQNIGYGIKTSFKYVQAGEFIVNLTVVSSGGNISYRNLTVWVDDQLPVAAIRTNLTGTGTANGLTLRIDQDTPVRFDGGLSTDLAYPGKNGVLPASGFAWDMNGDRITDATGRVVNWTFRKPGNFTVNLTVTDGVGWKGANATMTVIVNDTEAPRPDFDILDPTKDYDIVPRTGLIEGRNYTFNASKTTDNYDKASALNYTWTVPGPLFGDPRLNRTLYGMNITIGWTEWNNSYSVKLTVRDTGFRGEGIPGKPNWGNLTVNLTVQVDVKVRPDLRIDAGTMTIDNTNPEEGQSITVKVNVTNKAGRGPANSVSAKVIELSGPDRFTLATEPTRWLDKNGQELANRSIASGTTVTLVFQVTVVGQGNKTIRVEVSDAREPYTWVTSENQASLSILVKQPAWVNFAIAGSVIGVFAVFIFAMYYRRKVKAGEWQPLRRRREKGEEKKPKKEREVKEEKKRL